MTQGLIACAAASASATERGQVVGVVQGGVVMGLAGQAIHVTNQSMTFSARVDAHSRVVGCYMLFYALGSGLGALASTAMYARHGWSGVCLLGAMVTLLALAF